jgi:hypothetical protein
VNKKNHFLRQTENITPQQGFLLINFAKINRNMGIILPFIKKINFHEIGCDATILSNIIKRETYWKSLFR